MRTSILLVLGVGALVLDPVSGCFGSPDFKFGEREMRAAVEGTWQLTVQPPVGDTVTYTLEVTQSSKAQHAARGWVKSAAACGSRSFVRNASACMDTTDMPLDVHVASGPQSDAKGSFRIAGTTFQDGQLELDIGARSINAKLSPKGEVQGAPSAWTNNAVDAATFQLKRVAAK
jgi:hypothetical protein